MPNKRNPKNYCLNCDKKCKGSKSNLCKRCSSLNTINNFSKRLKGEFDSKYSRHKYQEIRNHAHKVMNINNISKQCKVCQYNYYVELCHIKSISDFEDTSPLSEINSLDNLIYLCPNHHKELDGGILDL